MEPETADATGLTCLWSSLSLGDGTNNRGWWRWYAFDGYALPLLFVSLLLLLIVRTIRLIQSKRSGKDQIDSVETKQSATLSEGPVETTQMEDSSSCDVPKVSSEQSVKDTPVELALAKSENRSSLTEHLLDDKRLPVDQPDILTSTESGKSPQEAVSSIRNSNDDDDDGDDAITTKLVTPSRQESSDVDPDVVDDELHELLADIDNFVSETSDNKAEKQEESIPTTKTMGKSTIVINANAEKSLVPVETNVKPTTKPTSVTTTSTPQTTKKTLSRVRDRYRQALANQNEQTESNASDHPHKAPAAWSNFVETISTAAANTAHSWNRDSVGNPHFATSSETNTQNTGAEAKIMSKVFSTKPKACGDSKTLSNENQILQAGRQLWSKVRSAAKEESSSKDPNPKVPSRPQQQKPRQLTDAERARLFAASVLEESDDYEKKARGGNRHWFGSTWSSE